MCVNIGHGEERVINAIKEQVERLAYVTPFMTTEPCAKLHRPLAELTLGNLKKSFFTSGGAEANENAVKIARMVTKRHKILTRYRSYHGVTAGVVILTDDPHRWEDAVTEKQMQSRGCEFLTVRDGKIVRWDCTSNAWEVGGGPSHPSFRE